MNSESLLSTIEPKSDQLNADDLVSGPMIVTVRDVVQGPTPEQPVQVVLDGHRPFRPCKSMRRVLIAAWGDQGKEWIGKSMTLFCDPTVKFGGIAVGGIRISHLSHINKKLDLMLTATRSRRQKYTVQQLLEPTPDTYPEKDFKANVDLWVKAILAEKLTLPELATKVASKGILTAEQIAEIGRRSAPNGIV